jgi:ribosomal protein S18 acetylase RimI-like enzyme
MTSPQQIDILDIRHFSARQLRPMLEQEAGLWLKWLRWDYRSSTDLLLQYLDSRVLPGFVALEQGRICGYTFYVYEGHKAVVGDLYTLADHPAPMAVAQVLSRHLIETLEASPEISRIEAQLLLFPAGQLQPLFAAPRAHGGVLSVYPRLFLERTLDARQLRSYPGLPAGIELAPWNSAFYQATAELIHASYGGHIDSTINDQYRTLGGSLRFLHNIVRFPGCGLFDPHTSAVLRDASTNTLAAVLLCSRVAPDTAHVTQLCVAPQFRGQGLGRTLLQCTVNHLMQHRYRYITLTVSEANTAALRLYESSDFIRRHAFDAMVLEKRQPGLHLV